MQAIEAANVQVEPFLDETFLRINMFGHIYSECLEKDISECMCAFPKRIVHGDWGPAAGPPLTLDLILSVAGQIPSEIIAGLVVLAVDKLVGFLRKRLNPNTEGFILRSLTLEQKSYDVTVYIETNQIDIDSLLVSIDDFVHREYNEGRCVSKIKAPCELNSDLEYVSSRWMSAPNYSLWLVWYKNGSEHIAAVYDKENGSLLLSPNIARVTYQNL